MIFKTISKLNSKWVLLCTVLIGVGFGYLLSNIINNDQSISLTSEEASISEQEPIIQLTLEERFPYVFPKNTTLSEEFKKLDISPAVIHQIVHAAKEHRDLARIKPGTRFQLSFDESNPEDKQLKSVHFRFSPREELIVSWQNHGQWVAEFIQKEVTTEIVTFKGTVTNTLWESAADAQMDSRLIADLAEIFAWQVDFSREVQVNDRWRLSVEKELVEGEFVGWGSVLSAEYINQEETHTAILYRQEGRDVGYFAPDGSSLRRMFLKSPIEFGRISSRFNRARFHPVLKTRRPHNGVDYAAPVGTPIRAVGDGVIDFAGWGGGGGNVIKIRHNSVYQTNYMHLSRFAKGIKRGTRVQQGQLIGYVGSTGLSTGPHLHFEFFVNGRHVDPLGQKFPKSEPISSKDLADFTKQKQTFISFLPAWEREASLVE
ncbi:MAG: peptidoglycan DD-metalloendopeptidase family protein [Bdellovibrionia bacterium]